MAGRSNGLRDWLARHDPGQIGLKRGIRAAIALPVTLFVALYVFDDASAASFAGFGAVGLLMTADYAGSVLQRTIDYLGTGIVVTGLIAVGMLISGNPLTAAIGTLVIAFLTYLAQMFRGNVAVGAPAALLMFIVAVCIGTRGTTIPDALTAWWIAVSVCTIVALVVLPRQRQDRARQLLADILDRSADMARASWLEPFDAARVRGIATSLDDLLTDLRSVHAGKPFRSSGVTQKERALSLLIDHVWGMRQVVRDPRLEQHPTEGHGPSVDAARELAQQIELTQRASAAALRDPQQAPSIEGIAAARDAFREAVTVDVLDRSSQGSQPSDIAVDVTKQHIISLSSMIVEQTAQLVREVNGKPIDEARGALSVPRRSLATFVRSQLTLDSGWLRNAVRSALGLAIAMVIVSLTDIQDGFWVLLGVIAVLRFDSFTTRRNAWQALLGTAIGVVVASLVIAAFDGNVLVMWILLPISVFLAGWSAVALKYPIAQASFTGFVLILIAITRWPPDVVTGTYRIFDIGLGALIAVTVALVIWPGGALGTLDKAMSGSIVTSWKYAAAVARSFATRSDPTIIRDDLAHARRALLVGSETYDVALMQRGPGMPRFSGWLALTGDCYLLVNVARTMSPFTDAQAPAAWSPSLSALVEERIAEGDQFWTSTANRVAQGNVAEWEPANTTADWGTLREAPTTHDEALGFVITVWLLDWFDRIDGIRAGAREPDATVSASA